MKSLGCLVLGSLWTASLADTGLYFTQHNVRLRRSPDKLAGGGGGGGGGDPLDWLRKSIPGEPGKDYPIHGQNKLCELNPAQFGGSCGGGGGKGKKNGGRKNGNGGGASKSTGGGGGGTGYGAPAEDTGADYSNDYEEPAAGEDYSYDQEDETAAASQPGGGYLAPEEATTSEADYDYNEEPADDYDYNEEPADDYDYIEAPADEEPSDYDYNEAPAPEEPTDYDYNVAPEAEEPGGGYLAPEETAEAASGSDDYEYDDYTAPAEDEAASEDLDTGYLAPAQSEGRRARNNRPATRKIAEELVSNARRRVKNGPNADDLRRLSGRTTNQNSVGRRSRNNRPHSQSGGNQQRRQKPKQNSIQRRKEKEISTRRQNRTQKRGQSSKQSRRTNTRQKTDRQVGNSVQCPGGSLDNCIDVCPGSSAKVYVACVTGCSSRCEPAANPRRRTK